jgi:hypothetical protein
VLLRYCNREARGTVSCADEWKVRVTPELLEQLEGLLGAGAVRLAYASPAAATAVAH